MTDDARGLLPCPFCGSDAVAYNDGEDCIATCNNSDCDHMPCVVGNATIEDAIAKWNRRAHLAAPALDQWVKCSERLPQNKCFDVLACGNNDGVRFWQASADAFHDSAWRATYNVTHWQPLPPLPKEEK